MTQAELWSELLDRVLDLVVCKDLPCKMEVADHGWYVQIAHVDSAPHACPACEPRTTPVHVISSEHLQTRRHALIVGDLVRWLEHLHAEGLTRPAARGDLADERVQPSALELPRAA
jgi:hypothetical protein